MFKADTPFCPFVVHGSGGQLVLARGICFLMFYRLRENKPTFDWVGVTWIAKGEWMEIEASLNTCACSAATRSDSLLGYQEHVCFSEHHARRS